MEAVAVAVAVGSTRSTVADIERSGRNWEPRRDNRSAPVAEAVVEVQADDARS